MLLKTFIAIFVFGAFLWVNMTGAYNEDKTWNL